MTWYNLPLRTTADVNASADIETLMEDIRVLAGNGTLAPDHSIQDSIPKTPYLAKSILTPNTTVAIDWTVSTKKQITLNANTTFTFTNPVLPTTLILVIIQDSSGSRTVTFPSGIKWAERTVPVLSTVANYIDMVSLYFDGTNYFGMMANNFG